MQNASEAKVLLKLRHPLVDGIKHVIIWHDFRGDLPLHYVYKTSDCYMLRCRQTRLVGLSLLCREAGFVIWLSVDIIYKLLVSLQQDIFLYILRWNQRRQMPYSLCPLSSWFEFIGLWLDVNHGINQSFVHRMLAWHVFYRACDNSSKGDF